MSLWSSLYVSKSQEKGKIITILIFVIDQFSFRNIFEISNIRDNWWGIWNGSSFEHKEENFFLSRTTNLCCKIKQNFYKILSNNAVFLEDLRAFKE